ncbi:MAG TPA: hypothetical protein VIS48_02830 [Candidatus Kryptonia bacterium]
MRYLPVLFAISVLTACSTAPAASIQSQAVSQTQGVTPDSQKASIDSVIQFLITSAATDFYNYGPHPISFRDVHIGHFITPSGEKQYMLCGQFLPAQKEGNGNWTPFVTIKTSGYEQYIGAQAAAFCQEVSVLLDKERDLSPLLQTRYDSLK